MSYWISSSLRVGVLFAIGNNCRRLALVLRKDNYLDIMGLEIGIKS